MQPFAVGDFVRLKSGSVMMIVVEVDDKGGGSRCNCAWTVNQKKKNDGFWRRR